jgi:hypothetical protein
LLHSLRLSTFYLYVLFIHIIPSLLYFFRNYLVNGLLYIFDILNILKEK